MTLKYPKNWSDKMGALKHTPTHFVEKIWKSLPNEPIDENFAQVFHTDHFNGREYKAVAAKKHGIVADVHNKWYAGRAIHFHLQVSHDKVMQFAPVKQATAVQRIEIKYTDPDGFKLPEPNVFIDGSWFFGYDALAKNEGFPSVAAFFKKYNKDFTGKIVHWTNLKY